MNDVVKSKILKSEAKISKVESMLIEDFETFIGFTDEKVSRFRMLHLFKMFHLLKSTYKILDTKHSCLDEEIKAIFNEYQHNELELLGNDQSSKKYHEIELLVDNLENRRRNIRLEYVEIFNEDNDGKYDEWMETKVVRFYTTTENYLSDVMKILLMISNRYSGILDDN